MHRELEDVIAARDQEAKRCATAIAAMQCTQNKERELSQLHLEQQLEDVRRDCQVPPGLLLAQLLLTRRFVVVLRLV